MTKLLIKKITHKKLNRFVRRGARILRTAILKNQFSKGVRKYARMEAKRALRLLGKNIAFQVRVRPRIKLVTVAVTGLLFTFGLASSLSTYIKAREGEIKVNGHAVLVADRTDSSDVSDETEIEAAVGYKRSPFDFKYPVDGQISQRFSYWHRAFDIAAPYNSPIKPLGSGRVEFAGTVADGKGHIVVIDHGDGLKTSYAHMNKILVGINDNVTSETELGTVGLTGRTTGPHVHLEVIDRGIAVNPGDVLPDR